MTATMTTMELIFAGELSGYELVQGDIIRIEDDLCEVQEVNDMPTGYEILATNDFGEEVETFISDSDSVQWYVYKEYEEE